jgi:hypothetical protein
LPLSWRQQLLSPLLHLLVVSAKQTNSQQRLKQTES